MSKRDASSVIYRNDYRTRYINYVSKNNAKGQPFLNIVGGSDGANEASEVTYKIIGSTLVSNDEIASLLSLQGPIAVSITRTIYTGPPIPLNTIATAEGVFMTDGSSMLYPIAPRGSPIVFPAPITSLAVDPQGNLYVSTATDIYENTSSGIVNMNITGLTNVSAMAVGANFYIIQDSQIYLASSGLTAVSIAGSTASVGVDGPGASARFDTPMGIALDSTVLWIADTGNSLIRTMSLSPPYTVNTVAGNSVVYLNANPTDNVGNRDGIGIHGENLLYNPQGITLANGTLYIADTGNNNIRALKNGSLTTISGQPGPPPVYEQSPIGYVDTLTPSSLWDAPVSIFYYNSGLYITEPMNNAVRLITLV